MNDPNTVLRDLRELVNKNGVMGAPKVKEIANSAISCIERLQKSSPVHLDEAVPHTQAATAELDVAPPDADADTLLGRAMDAWKRNFAKEVPKMRFPPRETKDLMLALARHTGDVQDRAGQGTKGEPDPCLLIMIQEHGFCQHCKGDVSLPGILAIGNIPKDFEDYEGKGYHMNWVGTKHRANFAHPVAP